MYEAVQQICKLMENGSEKIDSCMDFCSLPRLTPQEVTFLKEYSEVMRPLAQALNLLQGEENMFMGFLLPTLTALKQKLNKLSNQLTLCRPLLEAVLRGLQKR